MAHVLPLTLSPGLRSIDRNGLRLVVRNDTSSRTRGSARKFVCKASSSVDPGYPSRRKALIRLGEAALELSVASAFELNFRPKAPGDAQMNIFESILSLAPYKTDAAQKTRAEDALKRAQALLQAGDDAGAAAAFSEVLAAAPREYKLCQAALSGRQEANRNLGKGNGPDQLNQWCWGRGIRWPVCVYVISCGTYLAGTASSGVYRISLELALPSARCLMAVSPGGGLVVIGPDVRYWHLVVNGDGHGTDPSLGLGGSASPVPLPWSLRERLALCPLGLGSAALCPPVVSAGSACSVPSQDLCGERLLCALP
ncbi:hypothetical protein CYMTET_20420 [Cymbomonas tetramitiformis]|uniref:Uncharacterized protein n=1 Tax=Cymbomonas tetramitiformis TaxID=36881 RepID=A0AAE0L3X6_9CHLO|nr:hypothetical protein CYMTET_20420 [Cymbomonas tetramitiformis]